MYCISSVSERNMKLHALLGYPVSENFVCWCQTLKNSAHRFYVYRKPISSPRSRNLKVIQKLKCISAICVWCLDNWSRILSGKPFKTCSMARLKTLQFRLTLTPLFSMPRMYFLSLFHHFFFMICDWGSPSSFWVSTAVGLWLGYFFLFSWPSIYSSYWFTVICEILKNGKF